MRPHRRSPPQLTTQQKGKARATHSQLPTPSHTQQQSSSHHRERPGPNKQARRAGNRLRSASPALDQHQATDQRKGRSGASQQERQINRRWTHLAKIYGILFGPWLSEPELDQVLCYAVGQDLPREYREEVLTQFLDNHEVCDDDRKDPRFRSNVSHPSPNHPF